ncbi:MAG: hypothetical protein ACM30G_17890 [Micromonosporaceae bacterium]
MTTVAELLFERPADRADQINRQLEQRAGALGLLSHGVPGLTRQVATAIASLLDLPIGGLVLQAWRKQQAILKACEQTRGVPGATASVVVANHTLQTSQQPRVYLDVAGAQVPILELALALTLDIDAITVNVLEGHVTGCGAGTAAAAGELGVAMPGGQAHPLFQRSLKRIHLQPQHVPVTPEPAPPATVAS